MAGVAEKARFYMERSVPQLREWEQKEIFTKDEIRSIVQRRSDFEHRCLAPGVKPADFTAYAAWEISLDALRAKRCERLRVRHVSSQHATQGRVLAIYERGVTKRPASRELWLEYLAYCSRVKATRRWRRTVTRALRLMPRDADLWVLAGRKSAKNGDMGAARGYFMRGCRFCTTDEKLWLEYARCEVEWLARMEAKDMKRKGKGATSSKKQAHKRGDELGAIAGEQVGDGDEIMLLDDEDEAADDGDGDEVILPEPAPAKKAVFDDEAAETLEQRNPAMDGAIPLAIFDVARKQAFWEDSIAERFFDLFATFTNVSVQAKLLLHVLDALRGEFPASPSTWSCYIRTPIVGVSPYTTDFPRGLRDSLSRLNEGLVATDNTSRLREKTLEWVEPALALEDLDDGIRAVLEHTRQKVLGM